MLQSIKICAIFLGLCIIFPAPLVSATTDLSGNWQSTTNGMYYNLDPTDSSLRMHDVTANFSMEITQKGNQITILLHMNLINYTVDQAYLNEYSFGVPAVGGCTMSFVGTISDSSFVATEQYTSFTPEQLVGTFTADKIVATLNGDFEITDPNGIVVKRVDPMITTRPTNSSASNTGSTNTWSPLDNLTRDPLLTIVIIAFIALAIIAAIQSTRKSKKVHEDTSLVLPPPPPPI
jgi:hypothetical protein